MHTHLQYKWLTLGLTGLLDRFELSTIARAR